MKVKRNRLKRHLAVLKHRAPSPVHSEIPDTRIDKFTLFSVLFILASVIIPLLLFPEKGALWIKIVKQWVTENFGVAYLGFGALAMIYAIYITFSDIGQIKLGKSHEKEEYKTASWAAMMFCGGIGASILYWSLLEWAYYYQAPPFGIEPKSPEAIRWAATYGIFHWGPIAWAIYLAPAIAIAYFSHVRGSPVQKISYSLMPLLGKKFIQSNWGKSIDVLFIFGMIGGGATTLGLATPMISQGLNELFNFPNNLKTQLFALLFTTIIFAYSTFKGLKAGMQKLSNLNFYLALLLLLFVLIAGPTVFILNTGYESIGRALNHMVTMMTYSEAFGEFHNYGFIQTHFPKNWTVFYWAWWLVFAPTMGLFIAKISRGRTIRQMTTGAMFFGSLGCAVFFIVLGNYALHLQLSGQLDVVSILNNQGANVAIFSILHTLPFTSLVLVIFLILVILFTATTFDSISYILAGVVQKEVHGDPHRYNRLMWAFILCLLPATLLVLGGLDTLQTASIFAGAPLLLIMILMMASLIKAAKFDIQRQMNYVSPIIHIK